MKTLNLVQGTPEWHAHRATARNASEAAAVMGESKYMDRNELLKQKATGIVPEVDPAKQRLFDRGHETEEAARPLIEELIGEELYPAVATSDDGYLSASYDNITMGEDKAAEHKLWSESLAAQVRAQNLEPHYCWQLEQQCMVAGLDKILFVCSDGTSENFVHMEYHPVPGRAEQLLAAWKQFDADLAAYVHQEVIPAAVAAPTLNLPAVSVQVEGSIALISNLDVFGEALKGFIAKIPEKPSTDQEFADCKSAIGKLQEAQDRLDAAEANALGQIASFDQMRRDKALWFDLARTTRLALEKLVIARESAIKIETMQGGKDKLAEHIAALNKRLGKPYMPAIVADWAAAIKNKRTVASLQNAVDTLLAAKKIEASEIADRIDANLKSLRELAADHATLFADTPQIVLKANDDLIALIKSRIAEHKEAEQKRLDAEREKIRQEEEAKAQAAANEAIAKAAREQNEAEQRRMLEQHKAEVAKGNGVTDSPNTPAPAVTQVQPAAIDNGAKIRLGEICAVLGFTLTAEFLSKLGFQPAATDKNSKLYRVCDFPRICSAIVRHVEAAANTEIQRAA